MTLLETWQKTGICPKCGVRSVSGGFCCACAWESDAYAVKRRHALHRDIENTEDAIRKASELQILAVGQGRKKTFVGKNDSNWEAAYSAYVSSLMSKLQDLRVQISTILPNRR